jgi:hypothetical protein
MAWKLLILFPPPIPLKIASDEDRTAPGIVAGV